MTSDNELWDHILRDAQFFSELMNDTEFWAVVETVSDREQAAMFLKRARNAGLHGAEMDLRAQTFGLIAGLVQTVGLERAREFMRERIH